MIQRIQSVYLLLVTILLLVSAWMPVGTFISEEGWAAGVFRSWGVLVAGGDVLPTWGLFGILLLSALAALCTIFLFRNRPLQIRLAIFGSLLLIGYYIVFLVFLFVLKSRLDDLDFRMGWALCLPLVCLVLDYLAIRAIYRDEALVKAADRLR